MKYFFFALVFISALNGFAGGETGGGGILDCSIPVDGYPQQLLEFWECLMMLQFLRQQPLRR